MSRGRVVELARSQYGVFTSGQVAAVGVSRRSLGKLEDRGFLVSSELGFGLLELADESLVSPHLFPRTWAMWTAWAPDIPVRARLAPSEGVISHSTALRLYQIGGDLPGPQMEIALPDGAGTGQSGIARVRRGQVAADEWNVLYDMPVTTPARTLADLAADGPVDVTDLVRIAQRMVDAQLTTRRELVAVFERRADLLARGHASGGELVDSLLAASIAAV